MEAPGWLGCSPGAGLTSEVGNLAARWRSRCCFGRTVRRWRQRGQPVHLPVSLLFTPSAYAPGCPASPPHVQAGADPWKVLRQVREKLRLNAAAVQVRWSGGLACLVRQGGQHAPLLGLWGSGHGAGQPQPLRLSCLCSSQRCGSSSHPAGQPPQRPLPVLVPRRFPWGWRTASRG